MGELADRPFDIDALAEDSAECAREFLGRYPEFAHLCRMETRQDCDGLQFCATIPSPNAEELSVHFWVSAGMDLSLSFGVEGWHVHEWPDEDLLWGAFEAIRAGLILNCEELGAETTGATVDLRGIVIQEPGPRERFSEGARIRVRSFSGEQDRIITRAELLELMPPE